MISTLSISLKYSALRSSSRFSDLVVYKPPLCDFNLVSFLILTALSSSSSYSNDNSFLFFLLSKQKSTLVFILALLQELFTSIHLSYHPPILNYITLLLLNYFNHFFLHDWFSYIYNIRVKRFLQESLIFMLYNLNKVIEENYELENLFQHNERIYYEVPHKD
jgi:hypothetical protein